MTTTPWKPAERLHIPADIKRKYLTGYRGRFVRADNLDMKLQEGWQKVELTSEEIKKIEPITLEHGKPTGSSLQRGKLILCRMPEKVAEERRKYFESLTSVGTKSQVDNLKQEGSKIGVEVYSETKESKG
jgi:hypothetical protein